jgi:maltose alpha-D-glucosyltransferase/alpha-amylase
VTTAEAPVSLVTGPDLAHWYKDAVIYEVHVRAFQDSDGDGVGDFRGLISRLDYLQELGVTALWLLPFYPSPLRDDGYDIADYRRVNPQYGTLRDFRTFLREAHRRGLRVITELVLAHTSDEHPWFQRARRAAPGSTQRDYYMWSDTPERFAEARVIFKDFESSNWTWDPVAHAYFWHRFYSHQPSLNYDNPVVQEEIFGVVDYWLDMGVDGLRLDAVPYLYAREGTTCENLPETFAFLRRLRAHIDDNFEQRMLLAEANQWPEDAVAYMGGGDACHMAFHFPLMPRMFMAARQEDRFPIVDILSDTPAVPPDCQWALFLRNHDELTLEMVTDEERDYMYRAYAQDPQARVNVGIRRRLAPLLGNDRSMIDMMNGLLLSLPGTPIVYYGDEIGMGDNIYLGDRNAVRTPMQWGSDRNAGFSSANPQRLFLPVIIDPGYHYQSVNVEAQQENPGSLLWSTKRLLSLRTRHRAFARGSLQLLFPDNRKVLAFLREFEDERILVVVNLSRYPQAVELDLSEFCGATPVELFGGAEFPPIGELPYFVTIGGHGFYWFLLQGAGDATGTPRPELVTQGSWQSALSGPSLRRLEAVLPAYIAARRWYGGKSSRIKSVEIVDALPIGTASDVRGSDRPSGNGRAAMPSSYLLLCDVEPVEGPVATYVLPVAFADGQRGEELARFHPEAVVASLRVTFPGEGERQGVLYDAVWDPGFAAELVDAVARRRQLPGRRGRAHGVPAPTLRRLLAGVAPEAEAAPMSAEQSNTSLVVGSEVIVKVLRRVEPGVNPGIEMGRYLAERARFGATPLVGGSLEYRRAAGDDPVALVSVEEFVANEGDGFSYVVDMLSHGLEEILAGAGAEAPRSPLCRASELATRWATVAPDEVGEAGFALVGPHLEWSAQLGRRTAELHRALASEKDDPAFAPEALTAMDRQAMSHAARALAKRSFRQARGLARTAEVAEVLARSDEVLERLRLLAAIRTRMQRIRVHGDFHLGQVLWTGKDFVVVDFEGEPARSLGQRRLKRPALVDVAGMVRSFHYAARGASLRVTHSLGGVRDPAVLEPWLALWYQVVSGVYLHAYLDQAGGADFLPPLGDELASMLDFLLLDKAVYELGYEASSRPDWVAIPARGILELLETSA